MPSSIAGVAVDVATRLPDIQFPEFTAKLLTDTFDAIVAANLRQTESYIELVDALSKTLSDYIADTKDQISGAEILELLATTVPPPATASNQSSGIYVGATPNAQAVAKLKTALTLPGESAPTLPTAALTQADVDQIVDLAAKKLAASKYNLLKEMVKMGILRLVVTDGLFVSQLTFSTWASSFYQANSAGYNSKDFTLSAAAKTGKGLAKWVTASASTKFTSVTVRTTSDVQRDISGSSVNIFGRVEIHFRTDYQPLAQPE